MQCDPRLQASAKFTIKAKANDTGKFATGGLQDCLSICVTKLNTVQQLYQLYLTDL